MVQSSTEIANLAIAHCGSSKIIANIDTEKSIEATVCRVFYRQTVDETLNDAVWSFARKFANLSLVENNPTNEWLYSYRYPSDCIQFRRIVSPRLNNDTRQSRIPFTIGADSAGGLIYTNWPGNPTVPVACEYTFQNLNVAEYSPNFVDALSVKLAWKIVRQITGGDPFKLKPELGQEYDRLIEVAKNTNLNEEQRPEEPQSEFIRARDNDGHGTRGQSWNPIAEGFQVE